MSGTRTTLVSAASIVLLLALVGCDPVGPTPTPSPSESATEESTPTVTPEPEETETPEEPAPPTGPSAEQLDNIAAAIDSGNTAALEGYLADSVYFVIGASEASGYISPLEVIQGLDYTYSATGPWTFPVPNILLDGAQAGFYAQYFTDDAWVGMSSDDDPMVISFQFTGDEITGVFIIAGASLLMP